MKIYIKASPTTYEYEPINQREVTYEFLSYFPSFNRLPKAKLNAVVSGILAWKSVNSICYHHINRRTYDNDPNNILLVTRLAHNTIHDESIKDKLYRRLGLAHRVSAKQGPKAEQFELEMYEKLFQELGGKSQFSVNQFNNPQLLKIINSIPDLNKYDISNELQDEGIGYLNKQIVYDLIYDNSVDYNSPISITYLDDKTRQKFIEFLDTYKISDDYERYSIARMREIIDDNTMTRDEIDDYCKQLENQK